jgi:hypothetical protein
VSRKRAVQVGLQAALAAGLVAFALAADSTAVATVGTTAGIVIGLALMLGASRRKRVEAKLRRHGLAEDSYPACVTALVTVQASARAAFDVARSAVESLPRFQKVIELRDLDCICARTQWFQSRVHVRLRLQSGQQTVIEISSTPYFARSDAGSDIPAGADGVVNLTNVVWLIRHLGARLDVLTVQPRELCAAASIGPAASEP